MDGWSIDDMRRIVDTKNYGKVRTSDGPATVDLFTASAVIAVYDALKPTNQESAVKMPLMKFANFALTQVGRS